VADGDVHAMEAQALELERLGLNADHRGSRCKSGARSGRLNHFSRLEAYQ
jgi:hypothetical protein